MKVKGPIFYKNSLIDFHQKVVHTCRDVHFFQFLLGNSVSLRAENLLHFHRFLIEILSLKLDIFNSKK